MPRLLQELPGLSTLSLHFLHLNPLHTHLSESFLSTGTVQDTSFLKKALYLQPAFSLSSLIILQLDSSSSEMKVKKSIKVCLLSS